MKPLAIIAFSDALSAIEVAWSLENGGFEIVALQKAGRSSALSHVRLAKCLAIPDPNRNLGESLMDFSATLQSIAAQNSGRPIVLMPLEDSTVLLCSRIDLPPGIRLASPPPQIAAIALDKFRQTELAAQSGFHVIPTIPIDEMTSVDAIPLPCVLKPRLAIEACNDRIMKRPFYQCPGRRELDAALAMIAGTRAYIAQPYIEGVGEGVFGLATETGVKLLSSHRRIRMMNPEGSGSSACMSRPLEPELSQAATQFIKASSWRGLFMIELLRDKDGKAWFMEFNGRPWGSTALARRQGLEYPAWHAQLALGTLQDLPSGTPAHTTICRHIGREIVHFLFVLRGPGKGSNTAWPGKWATLKALLAYHPNQHWYNFRWSEPVPFFVDTWQCIASVIFKGK